MASSWARVDAQGAARWAAAFPNEDMRANALRDVLSAWAANDQAAATDWLQTLSAGKAKDAALSGFVRYHEAAS